MSNSSDSTLEDCYKSAYLDGIDREKNMESWVKNMQKIIAQAQQQLLTEILEQAEHYYIIDEGGYEAEKDPTIAVPISVLQKYIKRNPSLLNKLGEDVKPNGGEL